VCIVQVAAAHSDRNIHRPLMPLDVGYQRAAAGHNDGAELLIARIADEIRRRIGLAQRRHGPVQFLLQGLQQNRVIGAGGGRLPR